MKIAEERERPVRSPFLAHEQQRRHRREQRDRQRRLQRARIGLRRQPLAERPIADLVVVLQEIDERQSAAARRKARRAALPSRCADGSP